MNKEEPYRDQSERLKQRIQKINDKDGENNQVTENDLVEKNEQVLERDELPPREQIHRQKKQKTKWKLKYPVIRLLALCFILLPLIIFSVIAYRDSVKKINGSENTSGASTGVETINLETPKEEVEINSAIEEEPKENSNNIGLSNSDEITEEQVEVEQTETSPIVIQPPNTNEVTKKQESDKNNQEQKEVTKIPTNTTTETSKIIYHTVQPKETLYSLATKYYHSKTGIEIIRNANRLPNEQINIGQVLKIPLNN
ncbi:MAG: LysM peptidoglycan-binding domain-containing protein [Bacillus sp. (in: Bacteria)]|nr:LysM peptidoglycan-binding domain-containing protein [Bacillus sp. (in: firmicutes)]